MSASDIVEQDAPQPVMSGFRNRGIAAHAAVVTVVAFLVAAIVSMAYTAHVTGERATSTIEARLESLLGTVESALKVVCYVQDRELAKEVALGLMSNQEVLGVVIRCDAEVLAQLERGGSRRSAASHVKPITRRIGSPFSRDKTIGEITLQADGQVVAALRDSDIRLALQQLALQLLFVLLVIVVAFGHFFIRPMLKISSELKRKTPGDRKHLSVPQGHAGTELGQLVTDINALSDRLADAMDESERARQLAEAASEAKGVFLANMSHEIRTPMNAVLGLARIGARDSQEERGRDHFKRILTAGEHLLGVLNDILDFSRIEAGKFDIDAAPICLSALIAETAELVRPRCQEKGLHLAFDAAQNLPAWIQGDALRIRQILVNLLSNAVKFTARGRVSLAVRVEGGDLLFEVADEGIGMSAEVLERIFLPFEQANNQTTRNFGGTGLGLAISMRLARLMGGGIEVRSTVGRGSCFSLRLPLVEAAAPASRSDCPEQALPAAKRLAGLRVLAAEDVELNRVVLEDLLLHEGAYCRFAENGRQAVECLKQQPDAYDVVLMDIQMPEMDGYEATHLIRALAPGLPVIGLTAHVVQREQERCLAAGMVAHVAKPIEPDRLVAAIRQVVDFRLIDPHTAPSQGGWADGPELAVAQAGLSDSGGAGVLDWAALRQRFAGRPALVDKLLRRAVDDFGEMPAALRRLAAEANFAELQFMAHRLNGVSGNLSATSCQELAMQLEHAAGAASPECRQLAVRLADAFDALRLEIQASLDHTGLPPGKPR
jgi:signal transduction histidine kinase/HPt (histidine-containing phosphotransfer) domain-containing protein/ActR/RegA family two-component response regulator